MNGLEIKKYPAPILRKDCNPVGGFGEKEHSILEDMAKTMYLNQGIGLAASQVGINARLAVADTGGRLVKLVNPRILKKEGRDIIEEGCLSLPDVYVKVKRAKKILVESIDESGNVSTLEADGLLARVIQHEVDHLTGRLIIDYVNPVRKLLYFLRFSNGVNPVKRLFLKHRLSQMEKHKNLRSSALKQCSKPRL